MRPERPYGPASPSDVPEDIDELVSCEGQPNHQDEEGQRRRPFDVAREVDADAQREGVVC